MAEKNGNGIEPKRKPFKKGEREQTYALLAKNVIALDDDLAKVKKRKDTIERLKSDVVSGGYLEDDQQSLPIDNDDQDEARA